MAYLEPNTVEASLEKHIPFVTKTDTGLKVEVGSVLHPMDTAHYIDFIYVTAEDGGVLADLNIGDMPEKDIVVKNPKEVYAYCNLHGLWKAEL